MKPIAFALLTSLVMFACDPAPAQNSTYPPGVVPCLGRMPMAFTKNMGQWPDSIRFRASAGAATMWFGATGAYYQFNREVSPAELASPVYSSSSGQVVTRSPAVE
jgi:hypothetical protein